MNSTTQTQFDIIPPSGYVLYTPDERIILDEHNHETLYRSEQIYFKDINENTTLSSSLTSNSKIEDMLNYLSQVGLIYYNGYNTVINFNGLIFIFTETCQNVIYFSLYIGLKKYDLSLIIKSDKYQIKTNILNANQPIINVSGQFYELKNSIYCRQTLNNDHQWVNNIELIIEYESEIDGAIKNLSNSSDHPLLPPEILNGGVNNKDGPIDEEVTNESYSADLTTQTSNSDSITSPNDLPLEPKAALVISKEKKMDGEQQKENISNTVQTQPPSTTEYTKYLDVSSLIKLIKDHNRVFINFKEEKNKVKYYSVTNENQKFDQILEIKPDRFQNKIIILNSELLNVSKEIKQINDSPELKSNLEDKFDGIFKNLANYSFFDLFTKLLEIEKFQKLASQKKNKYSICESDFIEFLVRFLIESNEKEKNEVIQIFNVYYPPKIIQEDEDEIKDTNQIIKNYCMKKTHSNIINIVNQLINLETKGVNDGEVLKQFSNSFRKKQKQLKIQLFEHKIDEEEWTKYIQMDKK